MRHKKQRERAGLLTGRLRGAVETVLLTRRKLDLGAAEFSRTSRESLTKIASTLATIDASRANEQAVVSSMIVARRITGDLERAAFRFDEEAHNLLAALSETTGRRLPHAFEPGPAHAIGKAKDSGRFGRGHAAYIKGILDDADVGTTMTKDAARALPGLTPAEVEQATMQIVGCVSPSHRTMARKLLGGDGCHAVGSHGHVVTTAALEARTAWMRPPDNGARNTRRRIDRWAVADDGQVVAVNQAEQSAISTKFTSPEAFGWALEGLLQKGAKFPGGLDAMVAANSVGGQATIEIPADVVGLDEGDTLGYRPAGLSDSASHQDWILAREAAMRHDADAGPPVRYKAFDPVADATNPTVRFTFQQRDSGQWQLITMYV